MTNDIRINVHSHSIGRVELREKCESHYKDNEMQIRTCEHRPQ